jgi:hypothetical protein
MQSTRPRVMLLLDMEEEVEETPLLSSLGGGGGWKLGSSPATEWAIRATGHQHRHHNAKKAELTRRARWPRP